MLNGKITNKNLLTSGYKIIDYDLNEGTDGNCVLMGYKTTSDYTKAIKDIRFYSESSDFVADSFELNVNGKACTYSRIDTNTHSSAVTSQRIIHSLQ